MVNVIIVVIAIFSWRVFTINKMLDKFEEITDPPCGLKSPIEFWKMVFSLKKPIIENFISASDYYKLTGGLSNVFRVRILKRAKKAYLKFIKEGIHLGLCVRIKNELNKEGFKVYFPSVIHSYIPEFESKFLGGNTYTIYWWPISDTKSRIAALNKLIKLYS